MNYQDILLKLAKGNEDYIIMTAENRAAIRNITEELGNQFLDTGITEQTLAGTAAGLALRGRKPIIHALATFLTMRAYEFIRTDIGVADLPVKLVGCFPGFLSEANGPTHQAVEDIALMRTIPNMHIFCPSDKDDLIKGIKDIAESNNPTYIRYNDQASHIKHKPFKIGEPEIFGTDREVTILTYGFLFNQAFWASDILASKGIKCRVINLRMLNPINKNLIYQLCSDSGLIVTIEDHYKYGGLYSIIAEIFIEQNYSCPVLPIALENKWFKPLLLNDVIRHEKMHPIDIVNKIENYLLRVKNEYFTEWSTV
ncbi:MAG: hypothetical protein JEY94_06890 [Melioribacteraceae bacterium]|nr:hypothetical protein [Melioribacteraceae bacterium]